MQAYNPMNQPVGEAVEVPDNLPDFNHQAEQLMKQPGADKIKIFIPLDQLKQMSPTQKLLFELKNKAKIAIAKDAPAKAEQATNVQQTQARLGQAEQIDNGTPPALDANGPQE